jgi:hypothetical protein
MTRLLLLLLLTSCAKSPRNLYLRALDDHTEMAVVYRGFGTALRMRATYLSDTFRTTLAEERQRLVGVDLADHERFLGFMAEDGAAYHEIVFTAESDIEADTQFGETDDVWQLRLLADGVEETLVTVYKVRRPNALHTQIYAHMNLWNELWIARFARTVAEPQEVRLVVGSGYGHDEIVWGAEQLR